MIFLTPYEINLIQRDFEEILKSPEATVVKLRYYTPLSTSTDIDPVYRKPKNTVDPNAIEEEFPCLHDVMDVEKLKKYPAGFMKDGDAVFYFSTKVNLGEPRQGFPVVFESLTIIDALNQSWKPKLVDGKLAAFHHLFRIGQKQVAQAVACSPEK